MKTLGSRASSSSRAELSASLLVIDWAKNLFRFFDIVFSIFNEMLFYSNNYDFKINYCAIKVMKHDKMTQ